MAFVLSKWIVQLEIQIFPCKKINEFFPKTLIIQLQFRLAHQPLLVRRRGEHHLSVGLEGPWLSRTDPRVEPVPPTHLRLRRRRMCQRGMQGSELLRLRNRMVCLSRFSTSVYWLFQLTFVKNWMTRCACVSWISINLHKCFWKKKKIF